MTQIPWGELGLITYTRTYSRAKADGTKEVFPETVERIVDGCNTQLGMDLSEEKKQDLRDIMLNMKGMVAGRFLWQLGTNTVGKLGLASLQNCAVTVVDHPIRPFTWAMDMLMLGSGVGYNIQREHVYEIPKVVKGPSHRALRMDSNDADYIVPDSREGWVKLLGKVLKAYFYSGEAFTYSTRCIRGKGASIKGFGGTASGPEELCRGLDWICNLLDKRIGKKVRPIDCLDIMNILGYVVVAGNVRRSAQLAIGDYDDIQYLSAKRWDLGPIPNWRAMSNNSVACKDTNDLPSEFWAGYEGKGEPYGLINLKLSRQMGRLGETEYPDPDVIAYNPCISGDTKVLSEYGYMSIAEMEDQDREFSIWNGFEWSVVKPSITGHNQEMVTVKLSNGMELRCTKGHKWVNKDGNKIDAKELTIGTKLLKHNFPVMDDEETHDEVCAYTQGFYSGDGDSSNGCIWLYSPKYMCESKISTRGMTNEYSTRNPDISRKMVYPDFNTLPKNWVPGTQRGLQFRLDWLAGLCDSDGTLTKDGNIQISSIDRDFLKEVQLMLTTCGASSKISVMHKAGKRELPGGTYHCRESYRLMLGAMTVKNLVDLGFSCQRLQVDQVSPNRDATRFVTIVGIEESGIEEVVYCFTEEKRNLGCFNGIVTGQCAEQSLNNYETCCLAEVFLPNILDKAELLKTVKALYEVCKHSLALPCHHPETEEIVNSNMRMGIGVTGYLQASEEQRMWLSGVYEELREYDVSYSALHNFPESIKLTTVKPSGTLSLLAGVTSGCHPGYSQYFIRRIRIATTSPLVSLCRNKGYKVEPVKGFDGSDDPNTMVVEFPCSYPADTKFAKDMTAIEQMEVVKRLQAEWSDNSVSCTVYYRKEELDEIKRWLSENYSTSTKTISFLLHSEHGFAQAPFEEITKEEYDKIKAGVEPMDSVIIDEADLELEECIGGACPVK